MKRKLIKQGNSVLTISLPNTWIKNNNLLPGDEVELVENSSSLNILLLNNSKKIITLKLLDFTRESINRALIVNAYKSGYDTIELENSELKEQEINTIMMTYLLGFDYSYSNENIVLNSISNTFHSNFESLLEKQLFLIEKVIRNYNNPEELKILSVIIQRNDNFIKRILSKNFLTIKGNFFLWQVFSLLTHVARFFYHGSKDIPNKIPLEVEEHISILGKNYQLIKSSFLKKDFSQLHKLHLLDDLNDTFFSNLSISENNLFYHYLFLIGKELYLVNSSLIGYIQANSNNEI
jgi:hypothetical protein